LYENPAKSPSPPGASTGTISTLRALIASRADFLCGHSLLHNAILQRLIISETFNADSLRRTKLAKARKPRDGVTLARVKKLQHETATMLLPLQALNGSRLTAPETACADRSAQSTARLQQVNSSVAQIAQFIKEVQVRCSTDFRLPFLPSEDYWNVNNITNNLFDNVSEEVNKILQTSRYNLISWLYYSHQQRHHVCSRLQLNAHDIKWDLQPDVQVSHDGLIFYVVCWDEKFKVWTVPEIDCGILDLKTYLEH
ncbi:hypothetical protein T10_3303, partial [Trichinella papuae]